MSQPAEIIRREIAERGVLSFARFMELALYCPDSGYYEAKKDSAGRHGDFYTSVSAGELFGQLLAFQFAEWLHELRNAECGVRIVEAGAHDGRLAADIFKWLQAHRPELSAQLEYCIIEPSLRRQEWQKEALKNFAPRVRWYAGFQSLQQDASCRPARVTHHPPLCGVIFSNELLDAMPVHRFGWDAARAEWFEWGVAFDGEQFIWAKIQTPDARPRTPDPALCEVLPDGYTIETCPAAESWWRAAACVLGNGKLVTIDYGLTNEEVFSPGRTLGTLRAYFRHHAADDLLANPGEQDLTAHVNFSTIQSVGDACGLKTESFSTQAQFLTKIAEKVFKHPESFGEWGAKQNRQFQTLTHPEHLGRAFRVLIQSR